MALSKDRLSHDKNSTEVVGYENIKLDRQNFQLNMNFDSLELNENVKHNEMVGHAHFIKDMKKRSLSRSSTAHALRRGSSCST